jgi:N-acetylmuramoyl-L-alanine amidase
MVSSQLKSRLLREAVADNVATMAGSLPRGLQPVPRLVAVWKPRLAKALLCGIVLATVRLAVGTAPAAATVPPVSPVSPERPVPVAVASAVPVESYPRPQPVNVSALALAVRRVVIDAGHGGKSVGTSGAAGLHEKDLTLDVAERLRTRLAGVGLTVLMTRTGDDTVSLQERSEIANLGRGDIFVSIHVNALGAKGRGIETYYLGPSQAAAADAIAADENRDSGYSLADLRSLLDGIYLDARKDESQRLAESVQRALVRDLRRVNTAIEDRGVKTAPFVVLVGTRMPAILAEVSCLSNDEEAALLGNPAYRQSIAEALFDGIHGYLGADAGGGSKETGHGSH